MGMTCPTASPRRTSTWKPCASLDVPADQAVGIEDSANGVRALKAAGMIAVAVPSPGFSLPEDVIALADRVLDSMQQLSVAVIDGLASAPPA